MLHIVNKSPFQSTTLDSCLATARPDGSILLIEDAVYAATRGSAAAARLEQALGKFKIYVLTPDLEARGIAGSVIDGVRLVDYAGFVDLVAEHKGCQSWL
ncbi:MAG: sulfurtransferase complex subunit TusB [Pseudomonadota bacterium]|jgi:tRNA 2-thiouridine synthesizing protein B